MLRQWPYLFLLRKECWKTAFGSLAIEVISVLELETVYSNVTFWRHCSSFSVLPSVTQEWERKWREAQQRSCSYCILCFHPCFANAVFFVPSCQSNFLLPVLHWASEKPGTSNSQLLFFWLPVKKRAWSKTANSQEFLWKLFPFIMIKCSFVRNVCSVSWYNFIQPMRSRIT